MTTSNATEETGPDPTEAIASEEVTDTEGTEEPEVQQPEPGKADNPNREAAKYRTQLREAEAAREETEALLNAERAKRIESILKEGAEITFQRKGFYKPTTTVVVAHDPTDLARFTGKAPADYLDDTGEIDREKVRVAVEELYVERPYLFQDKRAGVAPNVGYRPTMVSKQPSLESAFRPRD